MRTPPRLVASDELNECAYSVASRLGVLGAQIAVLAEGELQFGQVGQANVELATAVTRDTVFQIGSTTKLYTACLVLQLIEQGLVHLDTPVAKYLPGFRLSSDPRWEAITPRMLMGMSSGLDNGPYADTGHDDDCVARYVGLLDAITLVSTPGSVYGYSNASTVVSGLLVEEITGRSWDDVLHDRILQPGALRESVSRYDELPYFRLALSESAHEPGAVSRPWSASRGMGPCGSSFAATACDLVRFGRIFLDRGVAMTGTRVLSAASIEAMQTPVVTVPSKLWADDWCLGPYRRVLAGVEFFGHAGTTEHGSSTLLWSTELDAALAVTVNSPSLGYPFAHDVLDAVLRSRFGLEPDGYPEADLGVPVDSQRYVGTYEIWGARYAVKSMPDGLHLTETPTGYAQEGRSSVSTRLLPIAEHRFIAEDDTITEHKRWDIAFTFGADPSPHALAEVLHNGAFAVRRIRP